MLEEKTRGRGTIIHDDVLYVYVMKTVFSKFRLSTCIAELLVPLCIIHVYSPENLEREEYHRKPVAMLRKYKPAVELLGHPIRTSHMDLGDVEKNRVDGLIAKVMNALLLHVTLTSLSNFRFLRERIVFPSATSPFACTHVTASTPTLKTHTHVHTHTYTYFFIVSHIVLSIKWMDP